MVGSSLNWGSGRSGGAFASPVQQPQEVRPMAAAATPAMAISLISFFIVVCDAWAESQGRSPPTTRQKVSPGPQNAAPGSDKMCYLPGITIFGTGAGGPGSEAQDERASPAKATTTAIIFAIFILELCVFQVSKTGPNNSTQYYRNLKVLFCRGHIRRHWSRSCCPGAGA